MDTRDVQQHAAVACRVHPQALVLCTRAEGAECGGSGHKAVLVPTAVTASAALKRHQARSCSPSGMPVLLRMAVFNAPMSPLAAKMPILWPVGANTTVTESMTRSKDKICRRYCF